jgi:hypothetical protein
MNSMEPTQPSAPEPPQIYPMLPSVTATPPMPEQQFRLTEITRLKAYLDAEVNQRANLRKKYSRGIFAVQAVE